MNYRDQISNSVHPRRTPAQDWHTELFGVGAGVPQRRADIGYPTPSMIVCLNRGSDSC
jgi:hypothetical protein